MQQVIDPMERRNDAVVQSSCDRRTLATVAAWLRANGEPVTSVSSVVRFALERMREIVITHFGADDVISSEGATDILKFIGAGRVNPQGRLVASYIQKVELEDQCFSGGTLERVMGPARKKEQERRKKAVDEYKQQIPQLLDNVKETIKVEDRGETRMPDNVVEEPEAAAERRNGEDEEMLSQLGSVPANAIADDEPESES